MSQFYLQNASRRSAQAFPISFADGAKFSDAKGDFAAMLGVPPEQIIRLTTAEGHIVLPGQEVPSGSLILEVERRAFDKLTGAGSFTPLEGCWSWRTLWNSVLPSLVVFGMFAGFTIILGGIASASSLCKTDDVAAQLFQQLFSWNQAPADVNEQFVCGIGMSLFWWVISMELVVIIVPSIILLFWAGSFNADTKGSWAYVITCTLNILTALLCVEAFTVVPGAYYAMVQDNVPSRYVAATQTMAAGVIVLIVSNFMWIFCQAFGKMIPEIFQCCGCCSTLLSPASGEHVPMQTTGVVSSYSPLSTPTKAPAVVAVTTAV